MDNGYVIYFPEVPDLIFYRSALMTVMQVSEAVKLDYGKWAERIVFKGELGKLIYDNFTEKKYNLNADMRYVESPDNEILMECKDKVRVAKGDVLREIGFEYTIEREVKPQITISLIKIF